MQCKIRIAELLKFIIIYSTIISLGQFMFHLPNACFYLNDLLLVVTIIVCSESVLRKKRLTAPRQVSIVFAFLLVITLIGFILNQYTPVYYLWGARNNFRAIVYYFCCCMCLKREDAHEVCHFLLMLLPINIILCTIQYFVAINSGDAKILMYVGDYVGGIFGNTKGCNRILNVYIIFVYIWILTKYLQGKVTGKHFVGIFLCCAYLSILSELKIIIVEIILTTPVLFQLIRKGKNKIVLLSLILISIFAFVSVWGMLHPAIGNMLRSVEEVINYSTANSYGANAVNRVSVIPRVHNLFLRDNVGKVLFGIGLGNADTSNFAFLNTPTFETYGYLRYNLFQSGFLYLETGALGLLVYLSFFIVNFIVFLKEQRSKTVKDSLFYVGGVFNIIAILCVFYNTTLRSEISSYLSFFFLALSFICIKQDDSEVVEDARLENTDCVRRRKKIVVRM